MYIGMLFGPSRHQMSTKGRVLHPLAISITCPRFDPLSSPPRSNMTSPFGPQTTCDEVAKVFAQDIKGKNVVVTGVSLGSLGAEVVRVLAPLAGVIWVCGRNQQRIQDAIGPILMQSPRAQIKIVSFDLTSLASVREAAQTIRKEGRPLHVLYNNASVLQYKDLQRTKDGFEAQFGGTHLGSFLFAKLLLPLLRATAADVLFPPRIVSVASHTHHWVDGIRFDDPNFTERPEEYEAWTAYGIAKGANILFTREAAKRYDDLGVLAFSLHPGTIEGTGILPVDVAVARGLRNSDGSFNPNVYTKSLAQGAATHIVAGFDPSLMEDSGGYLVDCKIQNDQLASWVTIDVRSDEFKSLLAPPLHVECEISDTIKLLFLSSSSRIPLPSASISAPGKRRPLVGHVRRICET
ncbi:NAD(P)-binding protein [Clavulina sp. PMI_390]|nr:NAD(P)-binding protein [Clavulina sp. PMI_390]